MTQSNVEANKAMEYIFRPVNLVTSSNSGGGATSGTAIR